MARQALLNSLSAGRAPVARALKGGVQAVVPAPTRRRALLAANRTLLDARPRVPQERLMR